MVEQFKSLSIPDFQAPFVDAGIEVFPVVRVPDGVDLARPLELRVVDLDVLDLADLLPGV